VGFLDLGFRAPAPETQAEPPLQPNTPADTGGFSAPHTSGKAVDPRPAGPQAPRNPVQVPRPSAQVPDIVAEHVPIPQKTQPPMAGKSRGGWLRWVLLAVGIAIVVAVVLLTRTYGRSPGMDRALTFGAMVGVLIAIAIGAVLLSVLAGRLRAKKNPMYWELACWVLVTLGILLRPLVVRADDSISADARGALIAGLAALFVLPVVMRLLNKMTEKPGLSHIATPLGVGFFLNVAQLMATKYVPALAWFTS
jgi:uncharacterized membrane protein YhaH (DUF805 family)